MKRINGSSPAFGPRGFALVVSVMLLVLISLLAVGMTGLASIELRRSGSADHLTVARDNARLALMQALARLQQTAGPDQRITASAEILAKTDAEAEGFANPHWTGVWRSNIKESNGGSKSFFERNDTSGGLSDLRYAPRNAVEPEFLGWMVSGGEELSKDAANSALTAEAVELGTDELNRAVKAPMVVMKEDDQKLSGHYAWWVGDLGVRANVGTRDAWEDQAQSEPQKWWRVMASQKAETEQMGGGVKLSGEEAVKLASGQTTALTVAGKQWADDHVFNVTVDSQGVLADVANGGLKRDLTAFLSDEDGQIAAKGDLTGLSDTDGIVGYGANDKRTGNFRHAVSSPTFGLLRDWAQINAPMNGKNVAAKAGDVEPADVSVSRGAALANERPTRLRQAVRSAIQPILVEATVYLTYSTYAAKGGWELRQHFYPRVVLWNPYNVELEFEQAVIMIQGNGRSVVETTDLAGKKITWLMFENGRSPDYNNDPFVGNTYWTIPATRFAPGDCLVFSPARSAEYNVWSLYNKNFNYNMLDFVLSCEVEPDVGRNYYVSDFVLGDNAAMSSPPTSYRFVAVGPAVQAEDTRAILKSAAGLSRVGSFEQFDALPLITSLSATVQYGAGNEPKYNWPNTEVMTCETLDAANPQPSVIPNVRTREAIRLRWFDEHLSNLRNSGALNNTAHFEEALLANWNPRASCILRSPWENIGGTSGPYFFGAYTRDLFDGEVSWNTQKPLYQGGRMRGNPFGVPQEGAARYVLFDVPRDGAGVISLAQYQHVKLSEFIWHPSYAIGNSLADPRLGAASARNRFAGLNRTAALSTDSVSSNSGGFGDRQIGSSADTNRNRINGRVWSWAEIARAMLLRVPMEDNLVYDLSFEVNRALWDSFFLSSGGEQEKKAFAKDPARNPLPNGRMRLVADGDADSLEDDLGDFHHAASRLMVDGAFNINSTRKEAWKALLASTRNAGYKGSSNIPFPRVLNAPGRAWKTGDSADFENLWDCHRELTPEEVDRLAGEIVAEVWLRGPFLSLADFVNRRLKEDETGLMGALESAIFKAGINAAIASRHPLNNRDILPSTRIADINITDNTKLEQVLKPDSKAWGSPAWLTQADVLQVIGPALSARSDTFVVRAYGDSVVDGKVMARAWCEAVVQRLPEPVNPDASGINPSDLGTDKDLGRRFTIRSFRWLMPEELEDRT